MKTKKKKTRYPPPAAKNVFKQNTPRILKKSTLLRVFDIIEYCRFPEQILGTENGTDFFRFCYPEPQTTTLNPPNE